MKLAAYVGLLLLLSVSTVPLYANAKTTSTPLPQFETGETEYTQYGNILIEKNADFEFQGWPGSGTLEDPYVISGLEIATNESAIEVSGTTVHFIIADCMFYSSIDPSEGMGIRLKELENGLVEDCVFLSINSGIALESVENCTVAGNVINQTNIPLTFYEAYECSMIGNEISGMVMVYDSDYCRVLSNNQSGYPTDHDTMGFEFIWSDGCLIAGNLISNNEYGLWLDCCVGSILQNNTFVNNGLLVRGHEVSNYDIEEYGNTVNGRPLAYFYGDSDCLIDGSEFGQVVIASCSNLTIQNGHFYNATTGVLVAYSDDCSIVDVTASGNEYGVTFDSATACNLNTSSVRDNYIGVNLADCSISIGVYNNTVMQNIVGISFESADYCEVTGNVVVDNWNVGIGVGGQDSWICFNVFGRNGINAVDGGIANLWDNGVDCGNWWDDMTLGAVYLIPGDARSVDRFPNRTAGTYTIPLTTGGGWIGNDTLPVMSPETLVIVATSVGMIVLFGVVIYTRRGRTF